MNTGREDCARIYDLWHQYARDGEACKLLDLYADDATVETPLAMAILGKPDGVVRGRAELRQLIEEGLRRGPEGLVRCYRTGIFFTNGRAVTWEYPRQTPGGDQVDVVEVMDVRQKKIRHHRVYCGWLGFRLLTQAAKPAPREMAAAN